MIEPKKLSIKWKLNIRGCLIHFTEVILLLIRLPLKYIKKVQNQHHHLSYSLKYKWHTFYFQTDPFFFLKSDDHPWYWLWKIILDCYRASSSTDPRNKFVLSAQASQFIPKLALGRIWVHFHSVACLKTIKLPNAITSLHKLHNILSS